MNTRHALHRSLASLALLLAAGAPLAASLLEQDHTAQATRRHRPQGYTLTAQNQDDGSILVTFELKKEPTLQKVVRHGQTYHRFEIPGLLQSGTKGFPEILSKQANLTVDPALEYTAELVDSDVRTFSLTHPFLPNRGEILRNQDPAEVPYVISEESMRAGAYPAEVIERGEAFMIRNVSGYNLRFAVTQVDTIAQSANVYKRLVFRVKPTGQQRAMAQEFGPHNRKVAPEIYGALQGMFLNAAPSASGESTLSATRAAWPYELGDSGELLVIYTARDAQAIQPYIDYKRSKGFTVTTKQVATGTHVKTTIQSAYSANPRILYVQLVGDWEDLKCDTTSSSGYTCPIDNALGLVSGNDNYLDLIVGRFSAASASDVTTQVNKAMAYEQNGAQSWMKKGLGIASNQGAGSGDDGESDYAHEDIIKTNKLIANGGFTSVATAYDYPSTASLSAATGPINSGLGVINYTGHGGPTGWATTGMNNSAVNSLTNGSATPIIFSVACLVGNYNGQTCFAETWLRKNNGGAVAAVMSTISQPWAPPMIGQDYMNDLLTGGYNYTSGPGNGTNTDHGKGTVGSIVMNAFNLTLGEDSSAVQTVKSWVIFGDATLKVRPTTPPSTVPVITTQPASVTVAAGKTATFTVVASGAKAYQWKRNGAAISGATGSSYTTPAVSSADNGASFTVTASNSAGSVTSNPAILRVADASTYALTVNNGSGDGSYKAGQSVTITANAAPSGQVFSKWTINSGSPSIANVNAASTTLTMPAGAVTVTATYHGGISGYTWCAYENGSYTFTEKVDVAYGASGKYYFKYGVTGKITFNNATFGDPIVGVYKSGYYKKAAATTVAKLYQHINYAGYVVNLSEGSYTLSQLRALGMQDNDISSVAVASGYRLELYQYDNFSGVRLVKTANDSTLVNDGFNDVVSSIKVIRM
jgi:gingipain R